MRSSIFSLLLVCTFLCPKIGFAQCNALFQNFAGATPANPPSGWLANGIEFKPSVPQSFNLAYNPAVLDSFRAGLNNVGEYIRTPLVTCPDSIAFYWRSSGGSNSFAVAIEYSTDNINWIAIDSIVAPNNVYTYKQINFPNSTLLPPFGVYIRWYMYRHASGACYVDEICMAQATCHAVASELRFSNYTQSCVASNIPFSVEVQATDNNGYIDTTYYGPISLNLISGSGALQGITTVNAVAGVANFNSVSFSGVAPLSIGLSSGTLVQNNSLDNLNILATCPNTDTLKVVSYNLLNYPHGGVYSLGGLCTPAELGPARWDTLQGILEYIKPDIFFVQELQTQGGADTILSQSLNVGGITKYALAPFIYNRSTINIKYNNACFYNTEKLSLYKVDTFKTDLRDCGVWIFYGKDPQLALHNDTTFIDVYGLHTKAKGFVNPTQDSIDRATECQTVMDSIRSKYTTERNGIIGGDLNLYTSSEGAYVNLTTGLYKFNDPIPLNPPNAANVWESNFAYAALHTQAARATWQNSLECGAKGGMDSRLDFLLATDPIMTGSKRVQYINGSYQAFGNDGNLFNRRIDTAINVSGVPQAVLTKLTNMSDHVPVQMLVEVTYPIVAPLTIGALNLAAKLQNKRKVLLQWNWKGTESIATYLVLRDGIIIAELPSNTIDYVDVSATVGLHTYKIVALQANGTKIESNNHSINIIDENSIISILPNPFTNQITIKHLEPNCIIRLKSITGQTILTAANKQESNIIIPTETLPTGIYFLQVQNNKENFVTKITKQF